MISPTSASGGGNVTGNGDAPVTIKGVCWNTVKKPTINDSHTNDGSGIGVFTSSLTGLMPGSRYYVRAYATNAYGTSYGNERSFTATYGSDSILVDASKDGGVWWAGSTTFTPESPHQGKGIADYLRGKGFHVNELPPGTVVTQSMLNGYNKIIASDQYDYYSQSELMAYQAYLDRPAVVLLIFADYHRYNKNQIAELAGFTLAGTSVNANGGYYCPLNRFAAHSITENVASMGYNAGSALLDTLNPHVEILGRLSGDCFADLNDNGYRDSNEPLGPPVMGLYHYGSAKIFFIGDLNLMEEVPQPLTDNLLNWAFNK
jgi:hypothetical protein